MINTNLYVRDPKWLASVKPAVARDGTLPFFRYVVRERGKVEIGVGSCASCHTRVMPGGDVIKGAQGNFPLRALAAGYRFAPNEVELTRMSERFLYFAPGFPGVDQSWLDRFTVEEFAAQHDVIPPGVAPRHRTSPFSPVQVPDLIGVRERRYLDRTGLQQHRGIADLMRYAALNQGGDDLADFGGFTPMALVFGGSLPAHPKQDDFERYSDEQLYALALYLYSLKPPANPNLPKTAAQKALVKRGEEIFNDSNNGCYKCHDPKLGYTNNKLIAVPGFDVSNDHPANDDIMRTPVGTPRRIGSDPALATTTRRGTGFYKVPSLLGVWYRGPFEHNGSVATLEDWFNPARTNDTYVPTGWKGPPGTKARAVKGHEFGLDLSDQDRKALVAFLKTL